METVKHEFAATVNGRAKSLVVEVPCAHGGVCTNKYCPPDLLTGGLDFIKAVNGELLPEFIADCTKQITGMTAAGVQATVLDVHIAGLMAAVMDHLARCGRLIFGDLLIYMDVFSLLLEADGFPGNEIRSMYPRVLRTIVDLYPSQVLNTADLSPFPGSRFDFILSNVLTQGCNMNTAQQ